VLVILIENRGALFRLLVPYARATYTGTLATFQKQWLLHGYVHISASVVVSAYVFTWGDVCTA